MTVLGLLPFALVLVLAVAVVCTVVFFILYGTLKRAVWLVLGIVFAVLLALCGGLFLLAGLFASFF